jgi:hypothetical protein
MFLTLMLTNLILATVTAGAVAYLFHTPIQNIMRRIVDEQIGVAWARYMQFAIFVTGISSGVRIYELERYITPLFNQPNKPAEILVLTPERWVLELYRTIISTLSGITWMLLAFFVVALVAYVVVRLGERKAARSSTVTPESVRQLERRRDPGHEDDRV